MTRYILTLLFLLPIVSLAETLAAYPGFNILGASDKWLLFSINNKIGISDIHGNVSVKPAYTTIHNFYSSNNIKTSHQRWLASKDAIPGILDKNGEWTPIKQLQSLIENGVKLDRYFDDQGHQVFTATTPDKAVGVVDLEGKWVIKPVYKRIHGTRLPTLKGALAATTSQGTDIFDMDGKLLHTFDSSIILLGEGFAYRSRPDGHELIRLDDGKTVSDKYDQFHIAYDGMISYGKKSDAGGRLVLGFLRVNDGNVEHGFVSDFWLSGPPPYFSEGLVFGCPTPYAIKANSEYARVFSGNTSGNCAYFDKNGKHAGNSTYYKGSRFNAGRAVVSGIDGKPGTVYSAWINRDGKVLARIDSEAHLWESRSNENVAILNSRKKWILFYPDGKTKEFDFQPIQ